MTKKKKKVVKKVVKRASITGINGFLGSALNKRLLSMGWETFSTVRSDVDYLFLFGSPSSDHWFKYAPAYSIRETIENFINALDHCREHNVKLIYPSSGTTYQARTPYSKTKIILDILGSIYACRMLGLRIFATYGPGEAHKNEYASVVYQFIQQMKKGKRPVIFGDGKQTRDFMYVNDVIDTIIANLDREGILDVGTGVNTSMNDVVKIINKQLGKRIKPKYEKKPLMYIDKTECEHPVKYKFSVEKGIKKMIKEMK